MNKQQAMTKLKRILGRRLMWREDPDAPTGEAREAAAEAAQAAAAAHKAATEALNERYRALLQGDAEYQRLAALATDTDKAMCRARGEARRRRITVGTDEGFAFHVRAEGDNWQDVVDQLTRKKGDDDAEN